MTRNSLLLLVLLVGIFTSCKDKDEVFPNLEIERAEITVFINESADVKILSGSGQYEAKSQNDKIAKTVIYGNILKIEGISAGEVLINVADVKSSQTLQMKVKVSNERTLVFASAEISEMKKINSDNTIQDLSKDNLEEYWGERIAYNTPIELRFKSDSLYIVKPNEIVEKYKIEWRGEELFLNSNHSTEWLYCGKKLQNKQFLLNTGFYKGESKNKMRTLQFAGQSYAFKTYTEIGNYPSATMIWTKMSFVFKQN